MARLAGCVDLAAPRTQESLTAIAWGLIADTDLAVRTQHAGGLDYVLAELPDAVPTAEVASKGPWTALFAGYLLDRTYPETGAQALLATRGRPDHLARLNGAFAGALWNERDRRLVLVADRWATRPLYWAQRGSVVAFGSTIRAVVAGANPELELDVEAVDDMLHIGWALPPRTLWRGIRRVPAATHVAWRGAEEGRSNPYWTVEFGDRPTELDPYVEGLSERLTTAVAELTARADHPLLTLSGGFDSRRLACELVRAGARPDAFTTTVPFGADNAVDVDRGIARAVADSLDIPLTLAPLPTPAAMPMQHRRTEKLVEFETGDHVWATSLLDVLPAGGTNFDGIGGDRLMGDYFYEFDAEQVAVREPIEIACASS